ncbi:MAG: DUF481 domain-containing protein [Terriglobia bacterium]
MKRLAYLIVIIILVTAAGRADVVTLKNGERLVGQWESVKNGSITFKSDTLGELTIPISKVASFSSSKPGVVVEPSGSTVQGQLTLEPSGNWQVTKNGKTQEVAASSVSTILTQADYTSLMEHHAKLWQDWKGNASFGYSLQRGDQQTGTINALVAATRERPETPIFARHFRTNFSLLMLRSTASEDGVTVRSNTISTILREDYLISPRNFIFGFGQLDHILAQGIYLRQTYGGGFGHEFIHTSRTSFNGLGGITFVNTKFYTGGPAVQSAEALVGETLSVALTKTIHFDHYLNFYPNLSNTGEYRFDTSSSLAFKLFSQFTANVGLIDLYLSNPTPGNHNNNVAFTIGLGYTF